MRRAALFAVALAVYLATLGTHAFGRSDYGAEEAHRLLAAASVVADGDVDVTDEMAGRAWSEWYPYPLAASGRPTLGRLDEPYAIGFTLLIAPAYAAAGPRGVEILLAVIAALAFVLGAALARRLVPEPWATAGAAAVALSPPAVAYGATVAPEAAGGALLAGAALLALRVRERPVMREAVLCAALVAALPWLDAGYLVWGLPVLAGLVWWLMRRGRRLMALMSLEVVALSLIAYATVNETLFGGVTPAAAAIGPGDGTSPEGYARRAPRLVEIWLDRGEGMLRWAPVTLLAFAGAWLLWRSRRDRLARAVPSVRDAEAAGSLLLLACTAVVAVAAFAPAALRAEGFPARGLVAGLPCAAGLVAFGIRRLPRAGAVLAAVTALGTGWLLVALRSGGEPGWSEPTTHAPWGPLLRAFPDFAGGSRVADVVAVTVAIALLVLLVRESPPVRERLAGHRP